jgi:hypothetical protein
MLTIILGIVAGIYLRDLWDTARRELDEETARDNAEIDNRDWRNL